MFKQIAIGIKSALALLLILLGTAQVQAQDIQLQIQAPRVVTVGEVFRVTFVANAKVDNFTAPNMEGFTVTAGPAQSTSSNISIVNGQVTQSVQNSFTYTLYADKEGKFTIGTAKIKVGNTEALSQPFDIECVKSQNAQTSQGGSGGGGTQAAAGTSGDDNLFLGVSLSKREVYRGEAITAVTKLYWKNTSISSVENFKNPAYTGFWSQELERITQLKVERENVNGSVYDAAVLNKLLLFPQQTGEIIISPSEIDAIIQVRTRPRDVFDDFFGGGYQNIRKHLESKQLKVRVKDLPSGAPASFDGAVGSFKIDASLSKNQLTANDATTLTIRISGNGNLKLINAPKVDLPIDFEVYDTKTTDAIKNTEAGSSGYRKFEIPIIPRSAGEFSIPPIAFSYFNPSTKQYNTLTTKELNISVERDTKAAQGYTSTESGRREGIKFLGKDIRFIKTKSNVLTQQNQFFLGSALFYVLYLSVILIFTAVFAWLKKHKKISQNVVLVRNRKANKVAKKRLRNSAQLLKMGNAQGFYDELLRAMWGYMSDKLGIPVAELSRESARDAFAQRNIEEPYIETFLNVVDECEYARYAPGSGRKEMEHVYTDAVGVISKLEQRIK